MRKIIFTLALFLPSSLALCQEMVQGYVFVDANGNNKKDKKELTLQGVGVSNGVQVVLTDKNGKYELPLTGDDQIFVIKPSGYQVALDSYNLPMSYITNKPNGSPTGTKYPGVEKTGKLPKQVNFALYPNDEAKEFNAFVFGDPQPYNLEELEYFNKAVVQEVKQNKQDISFGISLGDLVGDDLTLHEPYKKVMQQIGLPWYNVMGNHDMNYEATKDIYSDETFEKYFGPANMAFNYGDAHFIVLDDILYPNPRTNKGYLGGFREDQIEFIKNDLQFVDKDKLVVISLHIPLFIEEEDHFDKASRQALLDLLKDYENVLIMSAHTHYQMHQFYGKEKGYDGLKPIHEYNVGTTSGDWYSGELDQNGVPSSTMRDGTPRGYAILRVKDNNYVLDYKVTGHSEDYKMELFLPKVVADKKSSNYRLFANVFMGSEKDVVEYSVDGGKWKKMNKQVDLDPSFYAKVQKYDLTQELLSGKRPSNPINSTHLWSARLPFNIGVGEHKVTVRVTDMFGRSYESSATYRIEKSK